MARVETITEAEILQLAYEIFHLRGDDPEPSVGALHRLSHKVLAIYRRGGDDVMDYVTKTLNERQIELAKLSRN